MQPPGVWPSLREKKGGGGEGPVPGAGGRRRCWTGWQWGACWPADGTRRPPHGPPPPSSSTPPTPTPPPRALRPFLSSGHRGHLHRSCQSFGLLWSVQSPLRAIHWLFPSQSRPRHPKGGPPVLTPPPGRSGAWAPYLHCCTGRGPIGAPASTPPLSPTSAPSCPAREPRDAERRRLVPEVASGGGVTLCSSGSCAFGTRKSPDSGFLIGPIGRAGQLQLQLPSPTPPPP